MSDDLFSDLDTNPATSMKVTGLTPEQMRERASIVNGGETGYEQIKCPKCGGRGSKTYGYVNIRSYPCKMCHATGKVTARRIKAVEAAKKGRETAEQNLRVRRQDFAQAHEAEISFIARNSEWSDFYRSLHDQFQERGSLSDNQLASIRRGMEKMAAREAERAAEKVARVENAPTIDVSAIEALFASAKSNGLKKPKFRALDGIAISAAPANGRNAGALYVKANDEYAGKIVAGRFMALRSTPETVLPRLLEIAADPLGTAKLYGQRTGNCCCCGRELTKHASIDAGIGPICASKWGL